MADVVGDAAVLVPPGDGDALAGALETVLDGGSDVERIRTAGPERAAHYTWEASAAAHAEVYRSVVR
jgi:glycosyltransferase involved in cell wall biosynthesis